MSRTVTYSPAYTLVPTYECFNRCTYCNFGAEPLQSPWLTLPEAETQLLLFNSRCNWNSDPQRRGTPSQSTAKSLVAADLRFVRTGTCSGVFAAYWCGAAQLWGDGTVKKGKCIDGADARTACPSICYKLFTGTHRVKCRRCDCNS